MPELPVRPDLEELRQEAEAAIGAAAEPAALEELRVRYLGRKAAADPGAPLDRRVAARGARSGGAGRQRGAPGARAPHRGEGLGARLRGAPAAAGRRPYRRDAARRPAAAGGPSAPDIADPPPDGGHLRGPRLLCAGRSSTEKPRPTKMSSPAADLRYQVQVARPAGRVAGLRHVDTVLGQAALELRRAELSSPSPRSGLERPAHLVRALPHRSALLGRQLADRAQHLGQGGLPARDSARAAPRARPAGRRAITSSASLRSSSRSGLTGVQAWPAILLASSYSATVAAMAALRESGPRRSAGCGRSGAPARAVRRAAPRARRPGRPRPASPPARPRRAGTPPAGRGRGASPGGRRGSAAGGLSEGGAHAGPGRPWASTGRRSPARQHGTVAEPCAERRMVPTFPGSSTACR